MKNEMQNKNLMINNGVQEPFWLLVVKVFYTSEWPLDKEEIKLNLIIVLELCSKGTLIQFNETCKQFCTSF